MRQGPHYSQHVDRDEHDNVKLRLPLELEHEWAEFTAVLWIDNRDGTYTLKPRKD